MMSGWFSQKSLKGQLVTRFSIVLGLLMVIMTAGILALLALVLPPIGDADRTVRPIIAEALRNQGGRLVITETPELQRITREAPSFWFVASRGDDRVSHGVVPDAYRPVLDDLDSIVFLDVRERDGSPMTASVAELETVAGTLKVMYGGRSYPGSFLFNVLWGLKVVYLPLILIPVGLVFLALPLMVGKSLSGLRRTISEAASIDANSLGVRLPKEGVVRELHPLVDAINSALERIDEDVGQRRRFFANAAHELRTPIAILQTRLEGLPAAKDKDRLLMDVGRLAATAEQLLDLQRFGSVQSWADVDLVSICETVAADCAPLAIAAGYELEFDAEIKAMRIRGDRDSIERAVTNLVRNAIEHGGGTGRIRIEVLRDGTIEVTDEGPGIPPGEREKVFEPFYRVTPKSIGAGLGLSIVSQIAQLHKGHVSVIDHPWGARFRLKLG
ncbi:sensor histidine kinase [Rhizobium panacihumi]